MSEEQACRVAHNILCKERCHNILNSLGSGFPAPVTSPCVLAALVSHREEPRSLIAMPGIVSAELPASPKSTYAAPMADTSRALSHKELEQIVVNMRRQSGTNNRILMVGNRTSASERNDSAYDAVDDNMWMSTIEQMELPSSLKPITVSGTKLCPTSVVEEYRRELQLQTAPTAENIHLSLCGGMHMGADVFGMRQVGAKFTKTILVEKEAIKSTFSVR